MPGLGEDVKVDMEAGSERADGRCILNSVDDYPNLFSRTLCTWFAGGSVSGDDEAAA